MADTQEPNIPDVPELPQSTPNEFEVRELMRQNMTQQLQQNQAAARDPYSAGKAEQVNLAPDRYGGTNFERFYGKTAYNKLGFNPYINNENLYNDNTSKWEDVTSAAQQWSNLAGLGFSTIWSGKSDREEARDYERFSNIGSSTRGGAFGTVNNAFLNSGYTIGLLAEIAVEEVGLTALEILSGGGATPMVAARTAANVARAGKGIKKAMGLSEKLISAAKRLEDLKDIGKAKTFWDKSKKLGQAVNPLRGTFEHIGTAGRQYIRNPKTGRIEKLGEFSKLTKGFGTFYRDVREMRLALDEADLESGFISNTIKDDLIKDYMDNKEGDNPDGLAPDAERMELINTEAANASQRGHLTNSLLIYSTNRIAFGNYFNKWMPKAIKANSIKAFGGRRVINPKTGKMDFIKHGSGLKAYKTALNELKYAKSNLKTVPLATAKFLTKYTRVNFGEGMQEYFQEVIQDAEANTAKDRYQAAVAGGAWHNALNMDSYSDAYQKSLDKYISAEGGEVFMSGFLMGAFAGPFSYVSQASSKQLTKLGTYLYDKEAYQSEKEEIQRRQDEGQKDVDKLNAMTDSREKFLYEYITFLRKQTGYKEGIEKALENDDEKMSKDIKDISLVNQILFAEQMGGSNLIIDKLKDMNKLSEEDLIDAFSEQVGEGNVLPSDFKQSFDKVIGRAEDIQKMSQNFDTLFPDPLIHGGLDNSDFDTGIQEQDLVWSRQMAKLEAITQQHSLKRTMERMASIIDNSYTEKGTPFSNTKNNIPSGEITKIFNKESAGTVMYTLREEIKNLKEFGTLDPQQKSDLKYKEQSLSDLEGLFIGVTLYQTSLQKQAEIQVEQAETLAGKRPIVFNGKKKWSGYIVSQGKNKKGKPTFVIKEENGTRHEILQDSKQLVKDSILSVEVAEIPHGPTQMLEKAYKKYLSNVGDKYRNRLDETKIPKSFQAFKDFYSLDEDEKNLSKTVSFLMDPEGHFEFVKRFNDMAKTRRLNMRGEVESQLEAYREKEEENALIAMLLKEYNVFISDEDLLELFEHDQIPDEYRNVDTNELLKRGTKTFNEVINAIKTWQVRTERVEPEVKEETKESPKEEAGETTTTESTSTEETGEVVDSELTPEGYAKRINFDNFDQWPPSVIAIAEEALKSANANMQANFGKRKDMDMTTVIFEDLQDWRTRGESAFKGNEKILDAQLEWNNKNSEVEVEEVEEEAPTETPTAEVKVDSEIEGEEVETQEIPFPEVKGTLPEHLETKAADGNLTAITLGQSAKDVRAIVSELQKAGFLKEGQSLEDLQPGVGYVIETTDSKGNPKQVVLVYGGSLTAAAAVADAGGDHQLVSNLGLRTEPNEVYKYAIEIGDAVYYSYNPIHKNWIQEGKGELHLFKVVSRDLVKESDSVSKSRASWSQEIEDSFAEADNLLKLDKLLDYYKLEDTKREMAAEVGIDSIGYDQIDSLYQDAKIKFVKEMSWKDFKVGQKFQLKGKYSKFAVVKSSSEKGVVFIPDDGKKTFTIPMSKIRTVIEKQITDIAVEEPVKASPEQKDANTGNKQQAKEMTAQQLQEEADGIQARQDAGENTVASFLERAVKDANKC